MLVQIGSGWIEANNVLAIVVDEDKDLVQIHIKDSDSVYTVEGNKAVAARYAAQINAKKLTSNQPTDL